MTVQQILGCFWISVNDHLDENVRQSCDSGNIWQIAIVCVVVDLLLIHFDCGGMVSVVWLQF